MSETNRIRRTEANGLEARWILDGRHRVEIQRVRDTVSGKEFAFEPGTDLASAREGTPWQWCGLWDRIQRALWAELIP